MWTMVWKGIKRRKKEIRFINVVTFIAIFFLCGITLFQSVMNGFIFEKNLENYGNWVVSSLNEQLRHPYFTMEGKIETTKIVGNNAEKRVELCYVGTISDNMNQMGGNLLIEGRMPENEHEIIADIPALTKKGYHYNLGQTITLLYMDETGETLSKEYTLVGTMRTISGLWKQSSYYNLPDYIVTKDALSALRGENYVTYLYQLNPIYNEINTKEFADSFRSNKNTIIYNEYVYENRLWGPLEVYRSMTLVLIFISVLSLCYLLMGYISKRRLVYYQYRCMGATKKQVNDIILLECMYATFVPAVLAMLLAYILLVVGYQGLLKFYQMRSFYEFDIELFLLQIVAILGILCVVIFSTQLSVSDKKLAQNVDEVKPKYYKKLRKLALKTKAPEKTIWKRYNKIRPVQHLVSICFSVFICGVLVFCLNELVESAFSVKLRLEENDFFMNEKVKKYEITKDTDKEIVKEVQLTNMYVGIDDIIIEEINDTIGVKEVYRRIEDQTHYFTWDNMKESPIIQAIETEVHRMEAEKAEEDRLEALGQLFEIHYGDEPIFLDAVDYEMQMDFYEKKDFGKLEKVLNELEQQTLDWKKFEKGEQVVLFISEYYWNTYDTTLAVGDKVRIHNLFSGEVITEVEIGAIYYSESFMQPYDFFPTTYRMVASKALAKSMAEIEGKVYKDNFILADYEWNNNYPVIDKQLAGIASAKDAEYQCKAEYKHMEVTQFLQDVSSYGMIFILILTVYMIMQRNFLIAKNTYWQTQFRIFKQIGMEDKQYIRLAIWQEIKSYLWVFIGLVVGYGMIFLGEYIYTNKISDGALFLVLEEGETNDIGRIAFQATFISNGANEENILFVIFFYCMMVVSSAFLIYKLVKKPRKDT